MAKDTDRIEELEKLLLEAQEAYYAGDPVMSDDEYDALADELRDLDPKNATLAKIGAAAPKDSKLKKVKHTIPMGSQSKVNTENNFRAWAGKTQARIFIVEEKVDGLSAELVYKKGKLVAAITRGTGEEGEDVTHNVVLMQNVKDKLPGFEGSLRGEIIIEKEPFEKTFSKEFANPRNAAAGITRRKDMHKNVSKLKIIYYDCISDHKGFFTEKEKMEYIQKALGLECVNFPTASTDNVVKWYAHYVERAREESAYEMDGLVIKVNEIARQEELGETDGRPRSQIAWKFAAEKRETELKDVRWDVGLTGRITPVAVLDPVKIAGVTVTHATLHNVSNINKLKLWLGDIVLVSRRGDVIPQIEASVRHVQGKSLGFTSLLPPKTCPICGAPTEFEGEYLVCPNSTCPAKFRGDIIKWVRVLEIDQVGPAFVSAALEAGILKDPSDLYTMTVDLIKTIQGYGDSSANTIVKNVNKSREIPLAKFLAALNIPNAGNAAFTAVEKAGFDSLKKIQAASWKDFMKASGIGETTAKAVWAGLREKQHIIDQLLRNGIAIKRKLIGKLTGKSFCFTGEIEIKRGSAIKLVEDMGGEVKTSVGRGLDYLVQANQNSNSTKSQKAREYGTKVIGQKEFFDLVEFSFKKLQE